MRGLRGHISGLCLPTYVLDIPGGAGKVPLGPNYIVGRDRRHLADRVLHGRGAYVSGYWA